MAGFEVVGPVSVPTEKTRKGKIVDKDKLRDFWNEAAEIVNKTGCYVFGVSTGGGLIPWYVGKATKGFRQECFAPHKENHYNCALTDYGSGRPIMFFVVATSRGCQQFIDDVETFLIQMGVARNPRLRNDRKKQPPKWSIDGVIRSDSVRRSRSVRDFRQMMRL